MPQSGAAAASTATLLVLDEKRFLTPQTVGVQKAFFDHMFDYRQAWSTRKQWK